MFALLITLIPLLLADVINPVLFIAIMYTLGSNRPVRYCITLLLSFGLSYFVAGLLLAYGLDAIGEWLHAARQFDYAIEFLLALLLLYFGWSQYQSKDVHPEESLKEPRNIHSRRALWLGLQVNLVGLPLALPYLAAIDQILKAELSDLNMMFLLLAYNVVYLLPFVSMLLIQQFFQEASQPFFKEVYRWVDRISNRWLPWIFIALGILLLEDCISYFLGYREYSFMSLYT